MTFFICFVTVESSKVIVRKHFLGFISVESSTGENLSDILLNALHDLNIPINNMRG